MAGSEEQGKLKEIERWAAEQFSTAPNWATFYREVLGPHGIVRRRYPTREAMAEFEQTETYAEIQRMLANLRQRDTPSPNSAQEPIRVVTIRVPKSLHDAIRLEAHERRTSMNQLCISKLLQLIDNEMVPSDLR